MSKRKVLMRRKIQQAIAAGHVASVVAPKGMKRKSLLRIIEANSK